MHSEYIKRFPYNSEICTDILSYIKGNIKSFRVHDASSIHVSSSKKFDSNTFPGVRERAVGVTRRLPCLFIYDHSAGHVLHQPTRINTLSFGRQQYLWMQ